MGHCSIALNWYDLNKCLLLSYSVLFWWHVMCVQCRVFGQYRKCEEETIVPSFPDNQPAIWFLFSSMYITKLNWVQYAIYCFVFVLFFIVSAVYDCTLNFRNNENPTLLGVLKWQEISRLYVRVSRLHFFPENGMPIPKQISHKRPTDPSPRECANNFVPAVGIERNVSTVLFMSRDSCSVVNN